LPPPLAAIYAMPLPARFFSCRLVRARMRGEGYDGDALIRDSAGFALATSVIQQYVEAF